MAEEAQGYAVSGLLRGVLLLLVIALLGWSYWQLQQPPRSVSDMPVALPAVTVSDVVAVDIQNAANDLHFVRQQSQWKLVGHEAQQVDEQALHTLLDELASMRVVRTVAHGTNHDQRLGLDKAQRIHLKVSNASAVVLEADIGKQGGDLTTTFLRVQGSDAVVAVDKMLRWQLQRTAEGWLKAKDPAPTKQEGASSNN